MPVWHIVRKANVLNTTPHRRCPFLFRSFELFWHFARRNVKFSSVWTKWSPGWITICSSMDFESSSSMSNESEFAGIWWHLNTSRITAIQTSSTEKRNYCKRKELLDGNWFCTTFSQLFRSSVSLLLLPVQMWSCTIISKRKLARAWSIESMISQRRLSMLLN